MKRLLLVRHGESEWNAARRLQGQADIGLSPAGESQAEALAETIRRLGPDRVLSSDLKRARRTAELLGHADAAPEPGLREVDVGEWTGRAIAELIAAEPEAYRGWRAGTHAPPGGELWTHFVARTRAAVEPAMEAAQCTLVVTHGGVIRALLQALLGIEPSRIIPVGPGSLTILARKPAETVCRLELFNYSPAGPILNAPD
jgi:broad specificity phosphatase PhoE